MLAILLKIYAPDNPRVATCRSNLGSLLHQQNKNSEAEQEFRKSLSSLRRHYEAGDLALAPVLANLGSVLLDMRKTEEAKKSILEAIAMLKQYNKRDPGIASCYNSLACAFLQGDEWDEAERAFREAIRLHRKFFGNRGAYLVDYIAGRNRTLKALENFVQLEQSQAELVDLTRRNHPAGHLAIASSLAEYCSTLLKNDKHAEALPLLRECLAIREDKLPEHWLTCNAMSLLGESLVRSGKHDEAEPLLLIAYEDMDPPANTRDRKMKALQRIVKLYESWGKKSEAAAWQEKLEEARTAESPKKPAVNKK